MTCAALLAVACLLIGACNDGVSDLQVPTSATASPGAAMPSIWEEALAVIPDTPETRRFTTIFDFARAREVYGIAAPVDPADPAQREAYVEQFREVSPGGVAAGFLSGLGPYRVAMDEIRLEHYLGYRRVDQEVIAGQPPGQYFALRGLFDPEAADRALAACTDCAQPERLEALNTRYLSWREDFELNLRERLSPPVFDELGRGGRFVLTERLLMRTFWTAGIEQMIAARNGGPSLMRREEYRLLVQGLERSGAYSAQLTDETQVAAADAEGPLLEPYALMAAGAGKERDGEPFTVIVLVHATEAEARENQERLPRRIARTRSERLGTPWSEVFTLVDVQVEGRVLVAKLGGRPVVGAGFINARDPLLLHR